MLIPTIIGMSILIFVMMRLLPGDIVDAMVGMDATVSDEARQSLRESFGLADPWPVQYVRWMGELLQGDLGTSFRSREPISTQLLRALPITLQLAVLAIVMSVVVAIPLAGMLGIPATPSMRVRVVRRGAGAVRFALDEAALGMPAADAAFSARADATLSVAGARRRGWRDALPLPGRRGRAHRAHHHQAPVEDDDDGDCGGAAACAPALAATVSFYARVRLPAAAAAVPAAVLRPAAALIARAVLGAALPAFLSGIAADYATWAVGGQRGGVAKSGAGR
jgi:hypothetical protein